MKHFFRNFYAACFVLALVVFVGMQARRVVRHARAKQLVAEAVQHLKLNDFQETSRCLHAALNNNPKSIEATRLTADLLEAMGSPNAVSWRIRATQLQPANITNRLDWAQTAVKLRDFKSAEDALSSLDEDAKATARFHKIAGALAWAEGKTEESEQHYREARRLEPDNPSNLVNLGTIGLVSSNQEVAAAAKRLLESLASTNGPYQLESMRRLSQRAATSQDLSEAVVYAERVATKVAATFADKLEYLSFLSAVQNTNACSWLLVVQQEATNSPSQVAALGRWLSRTQGPTNALNWLSSVPLSLQTNQPVPLVITDCQIAAKNWTGLLGTVEKQNWGDSESLRTSLESLARRSLGQEMEAQTLWKRARRESARRLDRLYRLVQLTSAWGWAPERKDVLTEIVAEFPREKWAVKSLIDQLCNQGQTEELEKLLSNISTADPNNVALKAAFARVCLLRKSQLPAAHQLAKEAFDKAPQDPLVLSTYAYSLLLQGEKDNALRVLDDLKPQSRQIPWVATCYGLIEAQAGNKKAAREYLERAQTVKLLPEELELVRQASTN